MTVMCGNLSETVMTPFMNYMFQWVELCFIGRKPLKPWPWEPGAYITTQKWRQTESCPLFNRYNAIKKKHRVYTMFSRAPSSKIKFLFVMTTPSLCFVLIFVRCKLNPTNTSRLNFGNIPPGTLLDTKPFQSVWGNAVSPILIVKHC